MLMVKTYLGKSKIHGIGLFSKEFIPRGKVIWKFVRIIDRVIPEKDMIRIKGYYNFDQYIFKQFRSRCSRLDDGSYIMYGDDSSFINHSINSNLEMSGAKMIAKRDIQIGDELTEDYLEIYKDDEDIGFIKQMEKRRMEKNEINKTVL